MKDESEETNGFVRLEKTHRRIEARLGELEEAVAALADPARRDEAVQGIFEAARFFSRGAVRHHDDEEQTLFPRLAEVAALSPVVAALRDEHAEHDRAWAPIAAMVREWDEGGPTAREEAELPGLVARLGAVYRAHIAREERELFPAARAALGPSVAEEMGREMLARRGK